MATIEESNSLDNLPRQLPQDLITEILLRLPVKSLLRFRCVSKSWLSLISSTEFKTNYLQISTTRPRFMFGCATVLHTFPLKQIFEEHPCVDHAPAYDFPWSDPYDFIKMVDSCNGLVCLVFRLKGCVAVWNPAIRKYRVIPCRSRVSDGEHYGFGYDASSDDYKFVHIVHKPFSSYSRTYSLRNDSWKSSHWSHDMNTSGSGKFMNGAIHWMVYNKNDNRAEVCGVLAQSLATGEVIWIVKLPSHHNQKSEITPVFLQVLGERLCVCLGGFRVEVWAMEEYGVEESWSKVFWLDNYNLKRMKNPLLVTEKGVVTIEPTGRWTSFQCFENRVILYVQGSAPCGNVAATAYSESFVNPMFAQG